MRCDRMGCIRRTTPLPSRDLSSRTAEIHLLVTSTISLRTAIDCYVDVVAFPDFPKHIPGPCCEHSTPCLKVWSISILTTSSNGTKAMARSIPTTSFLMWAFHPLPFSLPSRLVPPLSSHKSSTAFARLMDWYPSTATRPSLSALHVILVVRLMRTTKASWWTILKRIWPWEESCGELLCSHETRAKSVIVLSQLIWWICRFEEGNTKALIPIQDQIKTQ